MALQLSRISRHGIEMNYWKITGFSFIQRVEMESGLGVLSIEISGWPNKESRDLFYYPLETVSYISDSDYSTKEEMYSYLKALPEFDGATDILEE